MSLIIFAAIFAYMSILLTARCFFENALIFLEEVYLTEVKAEFSVPVANTLANLDGTLEIRPVETVHMLKWSCHQSLKMIR